MNITRNQQAALVILGCVCTALIWASWALAEKNATTSLLTAGNQTQVLGAQGKNNQSLNLADLRNPFGPLQVQPEKQKRKEADTGLRTIGGRDEVQWTVPPGIKVPSIKVTGLMQAPKGIAACARVAGLGAVILKPEQRVMLTGSSGLAWFDVEDIQGRELTIVLDSGDRIKGSFF